MDDVVHSARGGEAKDYTPLTCHPGFDQETDQMLHLYMMNVIRKCISSTKGLRSLAGIAAININSTHKKRPDQPHRNSLTFPTIHSASLTDCPDALIWPHSERIGRNLALEPINLTSISESAGGKYMSVSFVDWRMREREITMDAVTTHRKA